MRAGRWTMAGVLSAGALLAACGGGEGELAAEVTAPTTDPEAQVPASTGSTWLDLLQYVPDTPGTRSWIVMGDVAGAAEVRGVDMPTEDEAADPVAGYYSELSDHAGEVRAALPGTDWMTELQGDDEVRAELGYSYGQVDAYLSAGEPPDLIDVLLGRFDAAEIDATLAEVPYWSEVQEEVDYGGATYHRWLDDLETDYDHISPARPLGHGGRMWVSDDHVVRTRTDALIEGSIDAAAGVDRLADDAVFRSLAEALDQPGVFGAVLTDQVLDGRDPEVVLGMGADPEDLEAYEDELAAGEHTLLEEVEAYGSAWGEVDGEGVAVLALAAADEDAALANEELFAERFGSGVSPVTAEPWADAIDLVESDVEGTVTIFWFEGDQASLFFDALVRADPVVATGG